MLIPFRKRSHERPAWSYHFEQGVQRGAASDFSGAEAAFREAVRLAPDEPYPRYELGYTLALAGRYEDALAEFRRTYELAHLRYGKAMLARDPGAAEQALRRCIELRPDVATAIDAKGHLAILCRQAGREDEARSIEEGVLADYPDHPQTVFIRRS